MLVFLTCIVSRFTPALRGNAIAAYSLTLPPTVEARVTIQELKRRAGVTYTDRMIRYLIAHGFLDRPDGPPNRFARYGPRHVEQLRAYAALRHNNTNLTELATFLREEGISVVEYVTRREQSIKEFGLGVG